MSNHIVQLVTFNSEWISVFQYGLDLVDNIMLTKIRFSLQK